MKFALRELDRLAADPAANRYNQAWREFEEREAWRSPICATIRFFDIMVQAALLQGIELHIWLYYFPPIVERMVRNYAPSGPLVDLDLTGPTPYNCLIYDAVSVTREWVKTAEKVPADQPNVVLRSNQADHENGTAGHAPGQPEGGVMPNSLQMCPEILARMRRWGEFEFGFTPPQRERVRLYADAKLRLSLGRASSWSRPDRNPAFLRWSSADPAVARREEGAGRRYQTLPGAAGVSGAAHAGSGSASRRSHRRRLGDGLAGAGAAMQLGRGSSLVVVYGRWSAVGGHGLALLAIERRHPDISLRCRHAEVNGAVVAADRKPARRDIVWRQRQDLSRSFPGTLQQVEPPSMIHQDPLAVAQPHRIGAEIAHLRERPRLQIEFHDARRAAVFPLLETGELPGIGRP